MSENTLKKVLNDISIKAQNSLGTFYRKIQPKISHNQLIYQFLRKSKKYQETKIFKNYKICQPLDNPKKLVY